MKKITLSIIFLMSATILGCTPITNTRQALSDDSSTSIACKAATDQLKDGLPQNVTIAPDSYEDAYSEVLDRCFFALKNPERINDFSSNCYNDCWMSVYVKEQDDIGSPLDYAGYEFIDLNNDGIKELLVGNLSDDNKLDKMIYAVYSLQHNIPKELAESYDYHSFSEKNYVYLCTGNKLITEKSYKPTGNKAKEVFKLSISENGLSTEIIDGYTAEKNNDGTFTYKKIDASENETIILESEWKKAVSEYESQKIQPDLIPFSQYVPKNSEGYYDDGDGDDFHEDQWIFGKGFSSWKEGYMACVNDNSYISGDRYSLINIDDDDIPELVTAYIIFSYHDGIVTAFSHFDTSSGWSYIEKQGLIFIYGGRQGIYYDLVYSLSEGKWKCIFSGNECANDPYNWDDFHYSIDGIEIDKQSYYEKLNEIYNQNSSTQSSSQAYYDNKEEILEYLSH